MPPLLLGLVKPSQALSAPLLLPSPLACTQACQTRPVQPLSVACSVAQVCTCAASLCSGLTLPFGLLHLLVPLSMLTRSLTWVALLQSFAGEQSSSNMAAPALLVFSLALNELAGLDGHLATDRSLVRRLLGGWWPTGSFEMLNPESWSRSQIPRPLSHHPQTYNLSHKTYLNPSP